MRMTDDHPSSMPCPCGGHADRVFTAPRIIADAQRFDLVRRPGTCVYENEKAELYLRVPDHDKDGRRMAFIPKIPCDPNLPKEERMKHIIKASDWTPPDGTVNPHDFVPDPGVTDQIRRSYLKGVAKT